MIEYTQNKLPAYVEYNDVPFMVYIKDDHVEAVNDQGIISTKLPEITHEGTEITQEEFRVLAEKRNALFDNNDKYKEVLKFADTL